MHELVFHPVTFGITLIVVIVFAVIAWQQQKKRSAALAGIAAELSLSFDASYNKELAHRFGGLRQLHTGFAHRAWNVMQGTYQSQPVLLCDYSLEETNYRPNNNTPRTHYFHVASLELPKACPSLVISPENFFEKIAAAAGFDDINFESAEFSRTFWVKSTDKKFAYDFCNAQMMEYLLQNPKLCLQVDGTTMAVVQRSSFKPDDVRPALARLLAIRGLVPAYLFDNA